MKLNWNFQRGGRVLKQSFLWGRYGYFLELHNNIGLSWFCVAFLSRLNRPFAIKDHMKVKNDHRSKFSNLSNWKEEA